MHIRDGRNLIDLDTKDWQIVVRNPTWKGVWASRKPAAFERNAEDLAEDALASGDMKGAVSALFDSDTALGLEAYGFILELSS